MRLAGFFVGMYMSKFSDLNLQKVFTGVVLRAFIFQFTKIILKWNVYGVPPKSEMEIVFLHPALNPMACTGNFR